MDISEYLCTVMPRHKEAWDELRQHLQERYVLEAKFLYLNSSWELVLCNGVRIELPGSPPGVKPGEQQHIQSVQIMVPSKQTKQYGVPTDGITEVSDAIPRMSKEPR